MQIRTLFLLSLGSFAIGTSEPSVRPPIVIGVSNVQSGPSRSLGTELVWGSRAYFNLVNKAGGIFGRQISLLVKDDKYEPEPAVTNTNELIVKDKAFFLFDYVGTPTLTRVLPLLRYYKDSQIVNVAPFTGGETQRNPPYNTYVFNVRASYREEAHVLVNYLYTKGFRKIGFVGQADSYGRSGQVGVEEALARHGLKIVASVSYRRNQSASESMAAQVSLLRNQGVDAVIMVGVYGPCSEFIYEARMSQWQIPIANVSFVDAESLLSLLRAKSRAVDHDLTGNLINSQVVPFPSPQYPLVKSYLQNLAYQSPGFTSLEGWINAAIVSEALRRAGPDPSRQSFIKAMESLTGWDPGIGCKLQFSHLEHQGLHKVWLTRTEKANWVAETTVEESN